MPASGVLASLRSSTYRSRRLASSLAAALFAERRVLARRGWEGEKSGLFEHPVVVWVSYRMKTSAIGGLCSSRAGT